MKRSNTIDCKSIGIRLRGFESLPLHQSIRPGLCPWFNTLILYDVYPRRSLRGEKSLWLFARESTLEAKLQRCGDGPAECRSNPSLCTIIVCFMKKIKYFKAFIASLLLALICFTFYITTRPGNSFSSNPEDAKAIGGFMSECSGGVIHYSQGYRCDGYAPSIIAIFIIFVGVISLIAAISLYLVKFYAKIG